MCGIAGLLDPRAASERSELVALATAMAEALVHRGPDDAGAWVDEEHGVAFGHRRLAVVGLGPEGHQPMASPSGRWMVSYNGELYNAGKLRRQLQEQGVSFRGHSDTEVLAASLDRLGLDSTLEVIEGMFAVAAWDGHRRCLYLVRDRFGEKPLYYGWVGGRLAFASELKAFHRLPRFSPEIDHEVVASFLRRSCVPAPRCIYRGVNQLLPGSMVRVEAGTGAKEPRQERYWSAADAIERARARPSIGEPEDVIDHLEETLTASVSARMVADVPVGALLSGGVDSSLVVALMQSVGGRVRTFTAAMPDPAFDESSHAAAVATHLGTEHTVVPVGATDMLDAVDHIPEIWDEPFSDSSQLPTYFVCRVARASVTVALSGDGADELFAGYNRHAWLERLWRVTGHWSPGMRRAAGTALRAVPPGPVEALALVLPPKVRVRMPSTKLAKAGLALQAGDVLQAYEAVSSHWQHPESVVVALNEHRNPLAESPSPGKRPALSGSTDQMLWFDLVRYLPDDILTKVDRAAMAVSLETRMPFLDRAVVEAAWGLPSDMRIKGTTTKWAVRRLLYRYVPASLVDRPKTGFGVPLRSWLRGPLRPWAEDLLSPRAIRRHGLLDPGPVRRAWEHHLSGRRDLSAELWDVLVLQSWMDRWGGRP